MTKLIATLGRISSLLALIFSPSLLAETSPKKEAEPKVERSKESKEIAAPVSRDVFKDIRIVDPREMKIGTQDRGPDPF